MNRIYQNQSLRKSTDDTETFIVINKKHRIVEWSPKAESLFKWAKLEALGHLINDLIVPPGQVFTKVTATSPKREIVAITKDGHRVPVEITFTTIQLGNHTYFYLSIINLTSTASHDEFIRRSTLLDMTEDGVYVIDSNHKIILWNKGAEKLYGYTATDAIGQPAYKLIKTQDELLFVEISQQLASSFSWEGEIQQKHKDGDTIFVKSRWSYNDERAEILVSNTNITDLKKNKFFLEYISTHDELTGLPNRRLLEDRIGHAIHQANRLGGMVGILLLDLDRFKVINDSLGHNHGDVLLKEVAKRIVDVVRDGDTVARLGGDEFIIVIENLQTITKINDVAEKIIFELSKPYVIGTHEIHITSSLGISIYPQDGADVHTLTRNADLAMYQVKGNNNIGDFSFYSSNLNDVVQKRLLDENNLRKAVENGEFTLHYQPKVSSVDNRMCGVEALVRWNHPVNGIVSPVNFIPLAEEIGLINQIGEWVLRKACQQNKDWQRCGNPPIQISVNMSVHQLTSGVVEIISKALQDSQLDPKYLDIEITESVAMSNVDMMIDTLERIRQLGVSLSIDDFGTGYSSLAYLKKMPFNTLKIDQSFIRGIPLDDDDNCIVKSIIALAHSMDLKVIAEGVTNKEQVLFLNNIQCDEMQGYLFSKPIIAKKIESNMIMKQWSFPYKKK